MSSACYLSASSADGAARIERGPALLAGKPVVKGTRITVELILRELADGKSVSDIVAAFPGVTPEDVRAALAYAADVLCRHAPGDV
jgi:uncharacterized protein (DUF433 family)